MKQFLLEIQPVISSGDSTRDFLGGFCQKFHLGAFSLCRFRQEFCFGNLEIWGCPKYSLRILHEIRWVFLFLKYVLQNLLLEIPPGVSSKVLFRDSSRNYFREFHWLSFFGFLQDFSIRTWYLRSCMPVKPYLCQWRSLNDCIRYMFMEGRRTTGSQTQRSVENEVKSR